MSASNSAMSRCSSSRRLLHSPVTFDRLGQALRCERRAHGSRREALDEVVDISFELGDEPALELALVAVAERIEQRPTQEPKPRHDAEAGHRPRAGLALAHDAGLRIGAGEGPSADVEMQLERAFELRLQRLLKLRRGEEARNLPFVLDSEEPVIGARGGGGQRFAETRLRSADAHLFDERAIALRNRLAARGHEMLDAPLDQRVERGRGLARRLVLADKLLDTGEVVRRAPAPFERLLVGFDRDAVELDRPLDRLRAGPARGLSARRRRA